jgi:NAD(P)-dependent dehydrogenase (short-subunit alcohol dehydrogenase family)
MSATITMTPTTHPVDTRTERRLAGKMVLVTGASRGLGRLFAETLAGAGAAVGLVARSAESLAEVRDEVIASGGIAAAAVADVSEPKAFQAAVEEICRQLGPVDVLINNAGVTGPVGAVWEVDPEDWWWTMEVNLRTVFTCTSLVVPAMIARGQGRIINLSSQAGVFRWPLVSGYSVSKAAVTKFTENLAVELKRTGVRAFSFHPGLQPIGMGEAVLTGRPPAGSAEAKIYEWVRRELEEGRGAEPDAAARFLLRIAVGDADSLTGRHLSVHDDLDALIASAKVIDREDLYRLHRRELSQLY